MQGLVVVCLIVLEDLECQRKLCQISLEHEIYVKVTRSMYLPSQEVREMCHARYDGCCKIVVD